MAKPAGIIARCKTRKPVAFLRRPRQENFDKDLQDRLAAIYPERNSGKKVVPPACLAKVILLQAACGTPDHKAIERTVDSQERPKASATPPCAQPSTQAR
ncbi:MAG: hypothetical protein VKO21_10160 [Candidatus Sericytochromatia bacterium]|nr:hypothetical protein [Candidatus Sericytochromatia bacterium]